MRPLGRRPRVPARPRSLVGAFLAVVSIALAGGCAGPTVTPSRSPAATAVALPSDGLVCDLPFSLRTGSGTTDAQVSLVAPNPDGLVLGFNAPAGAWPEIRIERATGLIDRIGAADVQPRGSDQTRISFLGLVSQTSYGSTFEAPLPPTEGVVLGSYGIGEAGSTKSWVFDLASPSCVRLAYSLPSTITIQFVPLM